MKLLDLFSGIGGFSLAASWAGWETVQFVELDSFCQKVLNKHFPNVPIHSDIKTFNGARFRNTIDIICGGFPCQPFSVAGKQKGDSDDRFLWPEMLRVIREVQPTWIVGENVPGIIRMELDNICASLENEGYEVQPFIIPSASIGAWDKRDRVWIIAHSSNTRIKKVRSERENTVFLNSDTESTISEQSRKARSGWNGCANSISNTDCKGMEGHSWHEYTKRQKDEVRRNGQANWLRNWIEVASELCRSNARVPNRVDRIKGLGNSVNPYVPLQIFKAINEFELTLKTK